MGIAEFITARLDEDEDLARDLLSAHPGPWRGGLPSDVRDSAGKVVVADEYHWSPMPHIARHDPARVLRRIEAGRRILARYQDCLARMEDPAYPNGVARDQAREYEDFVLPNLAADWDGHPDHREEWKP